MVVELAKVPQKLYIEVEAKGEHNTARAIIANVHTNIIYIEENGKAILDKSKRCCRLQKSLSMQPPLI